MPPDVAAYENLLNHEESIDYVGTRFHGGIFAMRHCKRSIIITLDERMTAMQQSIARNCLARNLVQSELEKKIYQNFSTVVNIDFAAVNAWKKQFA